MGRLFDGARIRILPSFLVAVSDAMHGNSNDIMKALSGDTGGGTFF